MSGYADSSELDATAKSEAFRNAISEHWLPALERFRPEVIFVSAGFDAHRDENMSHVSLTDADFLWVSEQIMKQAETSAEGRVISALEGVLEPKQPDSLCRRPPAGADGVELSFQSHLFSLRIRGAGAICGVGRHRKLP